MIPIGMKMVWNRVIHQRMYVRDRLVYCVYMMMKRAWEVAMMLYRIDHIDLDFLAQLAFHMLYSETIIVSIKCLFNEDDTHSAIFLKSASASCFLSGSALSGCVFKALQNHLSSVIAWPQPRNIFISRNRISTHAFLYACLIS